MELDIKAFRGIDLMAEEEEADQVVSG